MDSKAKNRLSQHGGGQGLQQPGQVPGEQSSSRLPQPRRSPMMEHQNIAQPLFAAPASNRNSVSLPPLTNSTNTTSTGLNSSLNAGPATGGIDRVNTPGRLRAFFDEVKRSRSVGDPVSIPQKYREMVTEEKSKVLRSDSMGRTLADTSFKLAAQRRASVAGNINNGGEGGEDASNSHTRRNTVITFGANHAAPNKRQSQLNPDSQTSPVAAGKSPGRNRTQFVLPKPQTNDEDMDDAEEMEGTSRWQDEGIVSQPSPAARANVDMDKKRAILKHLSERPPAVKINSEDQMDIEQEEPQEEQHVPQIAQTQATPRASIAKPAAAQTTSRLPGPQQKSAPQKQAAQQPKPVVKEAAEEEAPKPRAPTPEGMTRCSYCERSFMSDRVEKHMNVCQQNPAKSQRKVMDGTALRTKGTEFEKAMKKATQKGGPGSQIRPAPKKDWRAQHDQLMATVKAARDYD